MVDLSGGQDGPIEHGFSNSVFIVPAIIFVTLSGRFFDLLLNIFVRLLTAYLILFYVISN